MIANQTPDDLRSKSEHTRERLLKIALREFNKKGMDQVTMRDLAKAAALSLGAFYYHFSNKEEIVGVFYERRQVEFKKGVIDAQLDTVNFEKRLMKILRQRIRTFEPNRHLLLALTRSAIDPRSPISPFGEGTRKIREDAIGLFAEVISGSDLKTSRSLKPHLASLLWMLMMGVVLYWVYDESGGQKKLNA
ncbi:MAG: TetR family transcriptional regulator [Methylotenera sp.]|nr:TetR family transcriptional regulator [Oligoflexia bacterium]